MKSVIHHTHKKIPVQTTRVEVKRFSTSSLNLNKPKIPNHFKHNNNNNIHVTSSNCLKTFLRTKPNLNQLSFQGTQSFHTVSKFGQKNLLLQKSLPKQVNFSPLYPSPFERSRARAFPPRLFSLQTFTPSLIIRDFGTERRILTKEEKEQIAENRKKLMSQMQENTGISTRRRDIMREKKEKRKETEICCKNVSDAWEEEHPRCILHHWKQMPAEIRDHETLLHVAAQEPRLASVLVNALLETDLDINQKNAHGWTPLHYAINRGNLLSMKILLSKGADINILADGEVGAILLTTNNDSVDMIEYFHEINYDFTTKFTDEGTAVLHVAAATGALRILEYILENKLSPIGIRNGFDMTPLHLAAEYGQKEAIEILLKHGANINDKTPEGIAPIHKAAENNRAETLKFLIERGADPNIENELGGTPLFDAVLRHHLPAVQTLVEVGGVYVNQVDPEGNPPIVYAVEGGYPQITQYLVNKGSKVNTIRVKDSASLLNIALIHRHTILATWLLQNGADPNIPTDAGRTALHLAVINSPISFIKSLLEKGADLHKTDGEGQSPLHTAVLERNTETTQFLIEEGADPNQPMKYRGIKTTALHVAVVFEDFDTVQVLLRSGANATQRDEKGKTPFDLAEVVSIRNLISQYLPEEETSKKKKKATRSK